MPLLLASSAPPPAAALLAPQALQQQLMQQRLRLLGVAVPVDQSKALLRNKQGHQAGARHRIRTAPCHSAAPPTTTPHT